MCDGDWDPQKSLVRAAVRGGGAPTSVGAVDCTDCRGSRSVDSSFHCYGIVLDLFDGYDL
jgi:hypothetical protein